MHREGHLGAALAMYAPIGFLAYVAGFPSFAVGGGIGAVLLAMLPDQDMRIPFLSHRGITHTVWFALLVGGILGATVGYLARETGTEEALAIGAFAFAVGFVTITSHIVADALTPMGVTPFTPFRRRKYTVSVATASNPIANYALLVLGAALAGGTLYLATTVTG
ncbi:MAG: metal-dependent hydrolase [Halobacteriales archaeon]